MTLVGVAFTGLFFETEVTFVLVAGFCVAFGVAFGVTLGVGAGMTMPGIFDGIGVLVVLPAYALCDRKPVVEINTPVRTIRDSFLPKIEEVVLFIFWLLWNLYVDDVGWI